MWISKQRQSTSNSKAAHAHADVAGVLGRQSHDVFTLMGELNEVLDSLSLVRDSYDSTLSTLQSGLRPLVNAQPDLGPETTGTTEALDDAARVLERSIARVRGVLHGSA